MVLLVFGLRLLLMYFMLVLLSSLLCLLNWFLGLLVGFDDFGFRV